MPRATSPHSIDTQIARRVIQAFRNLGPQHITPQRLAHLRKTPPATERAKLLGDLALAPAWMQAMLRNLAQDESRPARKKPTRKTSV